MTWHPIETAPKDGRDIVLVWIPKYKYCAFAMREPEFSVLDYRGWLIDWCCDEPSNPSHWMPLPEPPE